MAPTSSGLRAVQICAMTRLIAILIVIRVMLPTGNKLVAAQRVSGKQQHPLPNMKSVALDSKATQALQRKLATLERSGFATCPDTDNNDCRVPPRSSQPYQTEQSQAVGIVLLQRIL